MRNVVIMSDSTCDLSKELLDHYHIPVIPLYVRFGDDVYRDGIDITTKELYRLVEERKCLPQTSAPSVGDFINFFKPYIESGNDILYIGISSKLSATVQNAHLAAQEFPQGRIHIIDSLNLSTGIGLLVLKACIYRKAGYSVTEMVSAIERLVPRVKTSFIIDTFDYLHKGGRCSALTSFVGTMLKIKPIIHVKEGGMIVGQKPRGLSKGYRILLSQLLNDKDRLDPDFVMVTYSDAEEAAAYLVNEINTHLKVKHLLTTEAGCVISSHCGRGTIGILYITK
ncbi:MAG TPA: DegV family protein [Haloplasmataceae bacterium]